MFLRLASDHARSRLDDGGGLLRADEYHTRKICQDSCISVQGFERMENTIQLQVLTPAQRFVLWTQDSLDHAGTCLSWDEASQFEPGRVVE